MAAGKDEKFSVKVCIAEEESSSGHVTVTEDYLSNTSEIMASGTDEKFSVKVCIDEEDSSSGHVTVTEDYLSNTSEVVDAPRKDSGHEKLISTQPRSGNKIDHCRPSRPPSYFCLAVLVTAMCNCPLGVLALVFSMLSTRDFKEGHQVKARTNGNVSKWISIVGIAISGVIAAFIIVYYVYIDKNIVDSDEDLHH